MEERSWPVSNPGQPVIRPYLKTKKQRGKGVGPPHSFSVAVLKVQISLGLYITSFLVERWIEMWFVLNMPPLCN